MKIILEREKCIGCGSCEAMCPKYWKMADDGRVDLLGSKAKPKTDIFELESEKIECNQEAADVCPVQCIRIDKS